MSSPLDRYQFVSQLLAPDEACAYWRAYDTALDREVVIRLVDADDPRSQLLNSTARAAAAVQDRRLSQILDVMEIPADDQAPARMAVVNEWIHGESLLAYMSARDWNPLELQQAITIVTEVGQAIGVAHDQRVRHGRLLASNVLITDAGEVRVIGMALDAVIFGTAHEDQIRSDVDALGGLLYLMLTGRTPFQGDTYGPDALQPPVAPRHRTHLEPASHVRADIPHELDVLISRSMMQLRRPRGTTKFRTVAEFLTALAKFRAGLEPVVARPRATRARGLAVRITILVAVLAGVALLIVAWRQLYIGPQTNPSHQAASSAHRPTPTASASGTSAAAAVLPAVAASSFDPFGDGNGDGRPDGLLGREHQALAARAIDQNASTSWSSLRYATANANGKGGVGLVIDLGASHQVEAVQLILGKLGAAVRVGVSQTLVSSPNAWPLLAKAPAGASHVSLRSPRPIAGRYVLLWFPRLPPSLTHPGTHQVRVSEVVVQGRG